MKLTENLSIEKTSPEGCVNLLRVVEKTNKETKKKYKATKVVGNYGNLYQCLIAVVRGQFLEELDETMYDQLLKMVELIEQKEEEIKNTFRTKVHFSKG